jgi:hypothetical protein
LILKKRFSKKGKNPTAEGNHSRKTSRRANLKARDKASKKAGKIKVFKSKNNKKIDLPQCKKSRTPSCKLNYVIEDLATSLFLLINTFLTLKINFTNSTNTKNAFYTR